MVKIMEKYKSALYLIPFSILMAFILDVDQGEKVSYTEILIDLLNVMVMGTLTYLIYKTNKRLTDQSEKQNQIDLELRINPVLIKLEEDINVLYDYSRYLIHNFTVGKKRTLLVEKFRDVILTFEEEGYFKKGTYERICVMDVLSEEGSIELNGYLKRIVVLGYFDYEDLSDINRYVKLLQEIRSNIEYRKISLKFTSEINYTVALSRNLESLISQYESYDFLSEQKIGGLSSLIYAQILDTISDLESAEKTLLEQIEIH